jgi:glycosyltransferase involved in cell wall biosynthesis
MKNIKTLLISPSGNLYGSEQVLLDYLKSSELLVDVCVPKNSLLFKEIRYLNLKHNVILFNSSQIWILYIKIGFWLLFSMYKNVYINEAGHSRYVILLSYLFPYKKFFIHVRILEDTKSNRWKLKPLKNTKILTISKFIKLHIKEESTLIYDPYIFKNNNPLNYNSPHTPLKIGIIGRITKSKGIDKLLLILERIRKDDKSDLFQFCLFGDISKVESEKSLIHDIMIHDNVVSYGFIKKTENIYEEIDCVLHLNQFEPLGRIFIEAIDFKKPFIGFNSAGIEEIGILVDYQEQLISNIDEKFVEEIMYNLDNLRFNYKYFMYLIDSSLLKAKEQFSVDHYIKVINSLLLDS